MSLVQTSFENSIASVVLCRSEKRNALSRQLLDELITATKQQLANEDVRALVIRAEGSVFCAGMDLGEMQQRATSEDGPAQWQKDSEDYCQLLADLYTASVPTIAVLQGPVLAGGVGMVLACDFVVASDSAFVSLPEPQRGITAAMVTPLLVHRLGAGPATQLLLSGGRMSAARAEALGMIYSVTAPEDLNSAVDDLLASILKGSKQALAITKQHVGQMSECEMLEKLRKSIAVSAHARASDDAREGLAAFLEKRPPHWQPKQPK